MLDHEGVHQILEFPNRTKSDLSSPQVSSNSFRKGDVGVKRLRTQETANDTSQSSDIIQIPRAPLSSASGWSRCNYWLFDFDASGC